MTQHRLTWNVASRAIDGADESGDGYVVVPIPGGMLFGVIDGLGHGAEAASATRRAINILQRHAHQPLADVIQRCHEALRDTRGAVMSLAAFDLTGQRLMWLGVGNVETALARSNAANMVEHAHLRQHSGLVGYRLPRLYEESCDIRPGDTVILMTDGVGGDFVTSTPSWTGGVEAIANEILQTHATGDDDALVLAIRYG